MSDCKQTIQSIESGGYDREFEKLYGKSNVVKQKERYIKAIESFEKLYGNKSDIALFSAPGRTEIGGNHTDHNHGKVIAASLNLDVIAVAAKSDSGIIKVKSKGYDMDIIDVNDLMPHEEEINKSCSLIRGTAAGFKNDSLCVGGFEAYTTSNVLKGSGMSSSAAFEVLIGTMLNHFYNEGKVSAVKIAQIAQYAENVFFGKPCGLMDQMASSVGGIITIDFADTKNPMIEKINYDFKNSKTALCIVDVGGDHADLTHEYASIPFEMKDVAQHLGCEFLRETDFNTIFANLSKIRSACGDRAALRALHFVCENERVDAMVKALNSGDFEEFKSLIIESGNSSYEYLQNVFCCSDVRNQPMSVALCISERILRGEGAWRVHGGGFGGTIQAFVPNRLVDEYTSSIESVFGKGSCHNLFIRNYGGVKLCMEE